MSTFLQALLHIGVDPAVAQVVDTQFAKVEAHQAHIAELQTTVASQAATLASQASMMTNLQDGVSDVLGQVSSIWDQLRIARARVDSLENNTVDSLSHEVTNLRNDLSGAVQQMQQLNASVVQLSSQVSSSGHAPATRVSTAPPGASIAPPAQPTPSVPPLQGSSFAPLPAHLTVDPRAIDKPGHFSGQGQDIAALGAFIESCEQYFRLTGFTDPVQQANMALIWLRGPAALWWRTVRPSITLTTFTWTELCAMLQKQFTPFDSARNARDKWAACVQGKLSVFAYIQAFRQCLLLVSDASPAETLDRFIRGLQPSVRELVLMFSPATFEDAALQAERVSGARGPTGPVVAPSMVVGAGSSSGHAPMDLGTTIGIPSEPHGSAQAVSGRPGQPSLCHYCKRPGHVMLSCFKLRDDMAARAASRGGRQGTNVRGSGRFAGFLGNRGRQGGARGYSNAFEGLTEEVPLSSAPPAPPAVSGTPSVPEQGQ